MFNIVLWVFLALCVALGILLVRKVTPYEPSGGIALACAVFVMGWIVLGIAHNIYVDYRDWPRRAALEAQSRTAEIERQGALRKTMMADLAAHIKAEKLRKDSGVATTASEQPSGGYAYRPSPPPQQSNSLLTTIFCLIGVWVVAGAVLRAL